MAKKVVKILKLIIPAGKALMGPPLGPILSSSGVNIKSFCDQFNQETRDKNGIKVPVLLKIYEDKSFSYDVGTPILSELIKRKLNIQKGSDKPNTKNVGNLTNAQLEEIAKEKMQAFNTTDLEAAKKIVMGTAKQMGVGLK